MAKVNTKGVTVKKHEDMPEWYTQVVLKSELADYSAVKGCAVIRPLGYALWQSIMDFFNAKLKALKIQNTYFPMFIPESFFKREAEHVEGFAPEVAWVEKKNDDEERLALRPTSETVMYESYSKWIRSHRDLPLLINQWCNIVRWEVKDVKLFLRSREFLWQEGHCVFATEEECDKHVKQMIDEYRSVSEDLMAVPAIIGLKSRSETFAGAKYTYSIESFMPDGKALQCGTSHNLGQGFAKAFNISFKGVDEKDHTPWQASWGFSTRLLGSLIMTHGDDKGLVLPPKMAPTKAVVVPILVKSKPELSKNVLEQGAAIAKRLSDAGFETLFDDRNEYSPGFKYNEWELKGVPLRIELGPRDVESNSCVLVKRNTGEKITVKLEDISCEVGKQLSLMHVEMLTSAREKVDAMMSTANNYESFKELIAKRMFVTANHCANEDCEDAIKADTTGATTRCRPLDNDASDGPCIRCGEPASYKIIFGKNY